MPLQIICQDITKIVVDAIVNTTNEELVGYSSVDLAVHEAAGPELDAECAKLAPLELGFAKITRGYRLSCKYIIHTSGPVWQNGKCGEKALLRSCYMESLRLAKEYHCQSIAFPLISSGTYGYPKDQVLRYAVQVISEFLYENEMDVFLCVFDRRSYELSKALLAGLRSYLNDTIEISEKAVLKYRAPFREARAFEETAPLMRSEQPRESIGRARGNTLSRYLESMDKSFSEMLFYYIDKSGMSDVECYKKANIDRRTFSKIKSNPQYKPSKQTAVAFAIALGLDLDNTQHLLGTAGLTLSRSNVFDKIIRYFIQNEVYDVFEINEALFDFDQVLLGC